IIISGKFLKFFEIMLCGRKRQVPLLYKVGSHTTFTGGGTFYGGVVSIDGTIGTINDTVNDPVVSKGGKRLL
ncbi:42735_t:CDS:2, partial [Gigaspora margarita]